MLKEDTRFTGEPVFEGMISLRAIIEAGNGVIHDRRLTKIWYAEDKAQKDRAELAWLTHRGEEQGFAVELVPRERLDQTAIGSSHGGVIGFATERTIPELTADRIKPNGFFVMLDGVEDPYNFGYAIRSLYAMGVTGVVLSPRNWMSAAGVVCRASAGASERIPMTVSGGADAVKLFRAAGYRILAADLRDSEPCDGADMRLPLFLLVGGEKRGISRRMLDLVDGRVRIDYGREFDQSLSAASAATILAYEVHRQNKMSEG